MPTSLVRTGLAGAGIGLPQLQTVTTSGLSSGRLDLRFPSSCNAGQSYQLLRHSTTVRVLELQIVLFAAVSMARAESVAFRQNKFALHVT